MPTELKGVKQLRYALKNFEPDLAKETQKEMASVLKPLVASARNLIPAVSPLSGWRPRAMSEARFPTWDSKVAKRGISFRTTPTKPNRRGFSYAASIHNKSAIGAIYETAGRRAAGTSKRSRPNFAQAFGPMEGKGRLQGRAMFAQWNRDQGRANAAVIKALQNAAAMFKSRKGA
jgi:hypothetical protein